MKRDLTVDVSKGIGIIFVVLGHIISLETINKFIYCFHMPLFFFISGISLYYSYKSEMSFKDFIKKRSKTILLPYFIFSIICFLYWFIIERKIRNQFDISASANFLNIFLAFGNDSLFSGNVVMWFLPCLFVSFILVYILMKIKKGSLVISALMLFIGFGLAHNNIVLLWTFEIALVAQFFIYTGYLFKNNFKLNNNIINVVFIISGFVGVIISSYFNVPVAMLGSKYGNPLWFLLGAFSGIFMILGFSNLINKLTENNIFSKQLSFLGINSIIIMICHEPLKRIILKVLSVIIRIDIILIRENLIYSIMTTFIVILIILPIIFIINRYLSFVIGKKKVSYSSNADC